MELTNTNNVIKMPPLPSPKLNGVGKTFFEKMSEFKNRIAHTDAETGRTETYKSILQKTIRVSLAMQSRGIKPSDIITICSNTTIDSFIPFYASFFLGAISANLDPKLPLADVVYLIKLVKPKIIFVIPEALDLIKNALKEAQLDSEIVVFGETSNYLRFSDFLVPSPNENKFVPYEPNSLKDTAVVVFTSGSTGLPKGACLNHYSLESLAHQMQSVPIVDAPILLTFANMFWISAITFTVNSIIYGTNHVTCSEFDPRKIWDIIKKYKVNGLFLNAFHALKMCEDGRPKDADTSTLHCVTYGGARTTYEQALHIKKCFPEAITFPGYGQTEANACAMTFYSSNKNYLELIEKYPDSIGQPIPGYLCKVVDPDTEEVLGPNQEGELRIKSDFLMNGYYKMDDSNYLDADGYFKTGDIVYYNEDLCFFVVDRIKELLKYQMWHVSPAKIEAILLKHPTVQNCLVIGIPHPVDGDHLMAVVVLKQSAVGKIKEEDLQKYVDDQVGYHQKLRAGVKFVQKVAMTATNKVSRNQTKKSILEGRL